MGEKVHKIHSLPDDAPWDSRVPPVGSAEHPLAVRGLDRVLSIQRPLVVAHIRSIRLRHPSATPAEIVRILENRYLAAVTTGGAAVGATAVVPGIGTGVTLALSGVETAGFMEATALFAQSIAEVHGITIDNPERARALVMTLMLGKEGVDLVSQLAKQATGKGMARSAYWGETITKSLPRAAIGPIVDRLKSAFLHQLATRGSASVVGKALPFGVGAVIGGTGNHLLGRRVLTTSRRAFGAPPPVFPAELEPPAGSERMERRMLDGVRAVGEGVAGAAGSVGRGIGQGVAGAAGSVGRGIGAVGRKAGGMLRRKRDGDSPSTDEH
ncbi:hypothetical protein [Microbacterium sp.]|uniref:hypothetical protein n=1 Tax=Microbacterium sp. TaxID=51671 RepID=UPI0028113AF8|nr:hypothetical protein [Microbacterium sp.]